MPRAVRMPKAKSRKLKAPPVPLAEGVPVPAVPVGPGTIGGLAGAALAFTAAVAAAIADQNNEAVAGVIVAGVALVTVIAGRFHQSGKAIDAAASIVAANGLPAKRQAQMSVTDLGDPVVYANRGAGVTPDFSRSREVETPKKVHAADVTFDHSYTGWAADDGDATIAPDDALEDQVEVAGRPGHEHGDLHQADTRLGDALRGVHVPPDPGDGLTRPSDLGPTRGLDR